MRVFYDKKSFIDIEPNLTSEMTNSGHVIYKDGKYRINRNHPETEYLFSTNLTPAKRKFYVQLVAKNGFVCNDCGKKHSFHVRPTQDRNRSINFRNMVNVCEDCRMKFLKSKDLFSLQFREQINWNKEKENVLKEMEDLEISDRNKYYKLSMEIVKLENFVNISLPSLKATDETHDLILKDFRMVIEKHLGENIDLNQTENRKIIRDYLMAESGGECMVCGSKYTLLTIDHVIAKDLGGSNNISNMVGMCQKCNKIKGNKTVIEFLANVKAANLPNRVILEALKQQEDAKKLLKELYKERESLLQEVPDDKI